MRCVNEIVTSQPTVIVCIPGDLNQLNSDVVESELDLVQQVGQPTHDDRILDEIFTNRRDVSDRRTVVRSLVPTKHMTVVICEPVPGPMSERRIVSFFLYKTAMCRGSQNCSLEIPLEAHTY